MQLWSYTVPSHRMAYLDAVLVVVFRTAAATPTGYVYTVVSATTSSQQPDVATVWSDVTAYGVCGDQWVGQFGILSSGNQLTAVALGTFADGTVTCKASGKWTEYDAFA